MNNNRNDLDNYINRTHQSDKELFKLFKHDVNEEGLRQFDKVKIKNYFVAMTPRSGSSYFMDLLKQTNQIGYPEEYLNPDFVPNISKVLQVNNLSDYLFKLFNQKSCNNIFGIKVSFFHFLPLIETGLDEVFFNKSNIIYLTRKNIVKQAISLYLATQSDVFHTNINHSEDKWKILNEIPYDSKAIKYWLNHIYTQELGWNNYLNNKEFFSLYYEDIVQEPINSIMKVLEFLNQESIDKDICINSIFIKLGNEKNNQFYDIFLNEKNNLDYLDELELDEARYST